jgi:ABC-2 type transport system permease protein
MSTIILPPAQAPSPLLLLVRVNALQAWRRLKDVRQQSRLLTGIILVFIVGYASLSFWLFYRGLRFIAAFPGLGSVLTERLLYLLFALLFGLLLLSNLVISYTNFFRNPEAAFLMSLPVSWETIFRWKFIESTLLASWAFLFLIAPFLAAFGLTRAVPWHFYVVTMILIGLFIVLPGVAGCWLAMSLARYLDRRSFRIVAVAAAVLLLLTARAWWKVPPANEEAVETRVLDMLDQLLVKTRFTQFPFLPSYWLSTSVIQWGEGVVNIAGFFMLVLLSHVAFFGFLAFTRLGRPFYEGASAVHSRGSGLGDWDWLGSRRHILSRPGGAAQAGLMEMLVSCCRWIAPDVRALLVKDARTFWRDTAQWGQSVMLFGLLGAYIVNLRHFTHQLTNPFWVNLVSYLNLGACSLNLATLTTRFVFPQFSLEGKRLWIIGMAPMGLERVVKAKYWLASLGSLVVTLSLMTLSSYLLNMPWHRIAFFGAVVAVMTFALNGLAVGLGVMYPNFKDANPSKIVSGFGGTLCLVLSFLYILASVLLLGFGTTRPHLRAGTVAASLSGFALLSFVIGWLPLRLGLAQLRHLEI